jgi:hypothetical protein
MGRRERRVIAAGLRLVTRVPSTPSVGSGVAHTR